MRLLLVRHAIAVPRGTPGYEDDARPLTRRGVRRFARAARGLRRLLPAPEVVLTSPLLRARHSAHILARVWHAPAPRPLAALASGDLAALASGLRSTDGGCVACVGHEPHLSAWLAHLLGATRPEALVFRKGGVALVELGAGADSATRLTAFLTPRCLRRLAR